MIYTGCPINTFPFRNLIMICFLGHPVHHTYVCMVIEVCKYQINSPFWLLNMIKAGV